ncbi:hypothetical protein CNMCM8060_003198 [Aspergillus lentulus]|nr:hypothetical protein CNMCM8060_003198 [Aspergillus lentulus]KAF4185088.1 hypothetical protein CNMCM7927_007113 [Aspergillus lentulus]
MHGILAVSALHLSLIEATTLKSFWLGLATAYKGQALHSFREQLRNVTPGNAKAMLGFAGLVVAFAFGSALTGVECADRPSLDALTNVFVLCRGVQEITNTASSFLRQSNFAPLFSPARPAASIPDRVRESLDRLDRLNAVCALGGQHDTTTYEKVVADLRELAAYTYAQPSSMTLAAGWAIRAPSSFLEYIQMKEPFALVVHAHYCAFLHMSHHNPFIQSWGSCVLKDIYRLLSSDWRQHVVWPVSEVFGEAPLTE